MLVFLLSAATLQAAVPVPIGSLLRKPAHYFNLEHKRIRYTPSTRGYLRSISAVRPLKPGTPLGPPTDPKSHSWRTILPFAFPFGGKTYREVYINLNGSLTFDAPESTTYPQRDTWPDGTMHSLASALDVAAIKGDRRMISPFWGLNAANSTRISTNATPSTFTVTWQAVRYQSPIEAYDPLGESHYQAILHPNGVIEFQYGKVAEKDGVTGLFHGRPAPGQLLDSVTLLDGPLRRAELRDEGSTLHFTVSLSGQAPALTSVVAMSAGEAHVLRIKNNIPELVCLVRNPSGEVTGTDCPGAGLAFAEGRTLHFYLPKINLKDPTTLQWKAESDSATTGDLRALQLPKATLSTSGNIYEVFHYPYLSKARNATFHEIYRRLPATADLAIALTDFRIDDIHNHGASNSTGDEEKDRLQSVHSKSLLQVAGPVFLGPRFRETATYEGRNFRNFPFAVAWMAHEMTHHWVAQLKWKKPHEDALLDGKGHWSPFLFTPALHPVWSLFTDSAYPQESNMGGMTVIKNSDGSSSGANAPWGAPTGLSALDLYSMGLIPAEEVPDTFVILGATPQSNGSSTGGDTVPVTIADIIAANGPRALSPRTLRFELYLLHETHRPPDPAKLLQCTGMQKVLARYFHHATNGRLTLVTPE
ncbi:MAG: hypothetical protein U0R19_21520 [Bryobacteraceae bacterium]